MFTPAPPSSVLSPPPPPTVSLPAPADILLLSLSPIIESPAVDPITFINPVNVSFPNAPPFAVPEDRFILTAVLASL